RNRLSCDSKETLVSRATSFAHELAGDDVEIAARVHGEPVVSRRRDVRVPRAGWRRVDGRDAAAVQDGIFRDARLSLAVWRHYRKGSAFGVEARGDCDAPDRRINRDGHVTR